MLLKLLINNTIKASTPDAVTRVARHCCNSRLFKDCNILIEIKD